MIRFLWLALLCGAFAFASPHRAIAAPEAAEQPMRFTIVRGHCDPGCPEWISAEGAITEKTPADFKRILKKMGKRRLPVVMLSSGGDVDAALAMGRMIRAKKLDVAVGMTVFAGCRPEQKDCKPPKGDNGAYRGNSYSTMGYCYSACPLVLAAGTRRLAGFWAEVGVHQVTTTITTTRVTYKTRYKVVKGKRVLEKKVVGRKNLGTKTTTKLGKAGRKKLLAYFKDMGIDASLLDIVQATPADGISVLRQEEMLKLGLITELEASEVLTAPAICAAQPAADNCFVAASTEPKAH